MATTNAPFKFHGFFKLSGHVEGNLVVLCHYEIQIQLVVVADLETRKKKSAAQTQISRVPQGEI